MSKANINSRFTSCPPKEAHIHWMAKRYGLYSWPCDLATVKIYSSWRCYCCAKSLQFSSVAQSCPTLWTSVMSKSLWQFGLQPTRLISPWDSPGKNTGVDCHALLQGIVLAQGSILSLVLQAEYFLPFEPLGKPLHKHHPVFPQLCLASALFWLLHVYGRLMPIPTGQVLRFQWERCWRWPLGWVQLVRKVIRWSSEIQVTHCKREGGLKESGSFWKLNTTQHGSGAGWCRLQTTTCAGRWGCRSVQRSVADNWPP